MNNQTNPQEITLESWLIKARKATANSNPKAAELFAGRILKLSKTDLQIKSKNHILKEKELLKLNNLLGRLLAGRSLSSVLKTTQFHNINLKINPRVLTPRAESEELVEYSIKNVHKNSTLIDIGTGSGAIGLSIAKARSDIRVILTDINTAALTLAKRNARLNHIKNIMFIRSNLIKKIDHTILLNSKEPVYFVANLPYISIRWKSINRNSLSHEPHSALYAGRNGLQLVENLIEDLLRIKAFTKSNWLLLEHDPIQLDLLSSYCKSRNLSIQKITDYVSLISLVKLKT